MFVTYLTIVAFLTFVMLPMLIPLAVTLAPKTSAGARRVVNSIPGWQRPAPRLAV